MIIFWVCNFLSSCVSLCVCARGSVLLHPPMWTKMGLCHLLVCCSAWVHLYMHFKIRRDDKHTRIRYTHLNFPSMHLNGSIHIQMRPNIRLSFPVCIYCCICITRANIYQNMHKWAVPPGQSLADNELLHSCILGKFRMVPQSVAKNGHIYIYIYTPTSETFLCKVSKISRM